MQVKEEKAKAVDLKQLARDLKTSLNAPELKELLNATLRSDRKTLFESCSAGCKSELYDSLRSLLLLLEDKAVAVNGKFTASSYIPKLTPQDLKPKDSIYPVSNEYNAPGLVKGISELISKPQVVKGVLGGQTSLLQLLSEGNLNPQKVELVDFNLYQIMYALLQTVKYNESGEFSVLGGKGTRYLPVFNLKFTVQYGDLVEFIGAKTDPQTVLFYTSNVFEITVKYGNEKIKIGGYQNNKSLSGITSFYKNDSVLPGSALLIRSLFPSRDAALIIKKRSGLEVWAYVNLGKQRWIEVPLENVEVRPA